MLSQKKTCKNNLVTPHNWKFVKAIQVAAILNSSIINRKLPLSQCFLKLHLHIHLGMSVHTRICVYTRVYVYTHVCIHACVTYIVCAVYIHVNPQHHPKSSVQRRGSHFSCVIWGIFSQEFLVAID